MGTLIGGRPDKDIKCPKIVETVETALTTFTEHRFLDDKMADTEDVENSMLDMSAVISLTRQALQEREGVAQGLLQEWDHYDGLRLITTSYPGEERLSATWTNKIIYGQEYPAAGP